MEQNRITKKKVFYMNFEATRLRGRPRNRWQDEVREDGRLFCFLDRAFSIMKTKINQQNAQINSGLIYY